MVKEAEVLDALKKIIDPDDGRDVVAKHMVTGIHINADNDVQFALVVDPARGAALEGLRQQAERAVASLKGAGKVRAVLTAERAVPEVKAGSSDPHGMAKNPRLDGLPVKTMIAVGSGKGGVGKSTVAFNIAHAFAKSGLRTGLLDADIYGPSVPMLSGINPGKPGLKDGLLIPHEAHGIKLMSMGFLNDTEQALIWRGPMVQTAIYQMFRDVLWGTADAPLDMLVIDLPPGTGDAQLTLAQKVPLNGAIIVSTPQDLALIDARKAVQMFEKTHVPVLGLIENMSTYICENCGHEAHIFGHGGAEAEAGKLNIPFLGAIPLNAEIRRKSDAGEPLNLPVFDQVAARLKGIKEAA